MSNFFIRLVFIITGCCMLAAFSGRAQSPTDSTLSILKKDTLGKPAPKDVAVISSTPIINSKDSAARKPQPWQPNPKKAGLYSALVPGLGQLYNRQYWKIPVVYVGLGTATYFFIQNLKDYQSYRKAYLGRINNPYPTDEYVKSYSTDQLQQLQNDYSRFVNLTVLFGSLGYALQVLDAITSAHLKNFDISRDISMRMKPLATPEGVGMGLVINFNPKAKGVTGLPALR